MNREYLKKEIKEALERSLIFYPFTDEKIDKLTDLLVKHQSEIMTAMQNISNNDAQDKWRKRFFEYAVMCADSIETFGYIDDSLIEYVLEEMS